MDYIGIKHNGFVFMTPDGHYIYRITFENETKFYISSDIQKATLFASDQAPSDSKHHHWGRINRQALISQKARSLHRIELYA